jgi:hypothetical protein
MRNMQLLHANAASQEESQAKIDSLLKEQREIVADVEQLAAKHEQQCASLQAHHESVLKQLSAAFQEQLSQAVMRASQAADASLADARLQQANSEARMVQQLKDQEAVHQQQLQQQQQEFRRMLQIETERSAAVREESTSQVRAWSEMRASHSLSGRLCCFCLMFPTDHVFEEGIR